MRTALREHWPEYLMEAAELGLFMLSAALFTALFYHPASPLRLRFTNEYLARLPMGLAMGLTAIAIVHSPLGRQSGAHFNPAVTLAFFRLGRVKKWDALFYGLAQFAGGAAAMLLLAAVARGLVMHPAVNFAATLPGPRGAWTAFAAELVISFALMSVVLHVAGSKRLARLTPLFAGALVATFITFEAPISGMSMNPARTLASALPGQIWNFLWIYFTAPPIGMLLAAELYARTRMASPQQQPTLCAKLFHDNPKRCIFCGKGTSPERVHDGFDDA